jgi:FkbM family methyltransferase
MVLDVGAHEGQSGRELFDAGFNGGLISFEPMPGAYQRLEASASRYRASGKSWRVAPRGAVGASRETATMNIAANGVSSSLMPMAESHLEAAPDSKLTGGISVDVRPLSDLLADMKVDAARIFLKIDTQGYEDAVLTGALAVMDRIAGIKLEQSAIELYQGQKLYHDMDRRIREMGFDLWDIVPGFRHPANGRLLQFDGIYLR